VASDMEIIKKRVRVAMALGDCQEEIELEHEVEFPVKVRKIRSVCVSISEIETRPEEGTVCVEGKLCKRFSWVADCDGEYNGVNYEAGGIYDLPIEERFTHYLALKDLLPSADAQAQVRIKKVGEPTKCLSGDDVPDIWKQSVVLETYVTADMPVEAEIVTDIYASGKDLKITKATCGIEDLKGQCEKEINVVADIDFSRCVAKILNVQTRLTDLKAEVLTDQIMVGGVLRKRIYYVEQDTNRMYETTIKESWSEVFDLPGVQPGMEVRVEALVSYCDVVLKPEDNTKARQKAVIKVKCKVVEDVVLNYIKDVTGTDCKVIKGSLQCNDLVGYGCVEVAVRDDICFDHPVKKIMNKDATVSFDYKKTEVHYGGVKVVGELYKNICYVDRCDGAVWEECFSEPFETKIDIPDAEQGMKVRLSSRVKEIDLVSPDYPMDCCYGPFSAKNYPWQQTAIVEVKAKVFAPKKMEAVTDIICEPVPSPTPCPTTTPCPTKPPCPSPTPTIHPTPTPKPTDCPPGQPGQPSMRFYIIQQGDTLYKLAQRYGTTVEAIMALNPGIDPYNLQIGQVIRIPCGVPGAKG
jgi:hypothetical protein